VSGKGTEFRQSAGHRLGEALDRLVPDGDVGLAVSGGPDSLALLLLAAETRPGRVRAATVDHALRPESAGEASEVARICGSLGVPHDVLTVRVGGGASLQAQAREARYEALGNWAQDHRLAAVATAHHADDQAETVLMRLARGSGLGGLAGIREARPLVDGVTLVRPLLEWRKADLQALVAAAGLSAVNDAANHDRRFDRTRARALLAEHDWFDPVRVARTALALAAAEQALAAWAEELGALHLVREEGAVRLQRMDMLPFELQRRLLLRALQGCKGEVPSGPEIERALVGLTAGRSLTLRGLKLSAKGGEWLVQPAPPRRLHP
jgi:tRNA(Ile)-lysidine synthase